MVAMFRLHSKVSVFDGCWHLNLIGFDETIQTWQRLPSGHTGWCSASGGCRYVGSIGQLIELLKQCLRGKPCYRYCSFRYHY
jgi:hypothetical protein